MVCEVPLGFLDRSPPSSDHVLVCTSGSHITTKRVTSGRRRRCSRFLLSSFQATNLFWIQQRCAERLIAPCPPALTGHSPSGGALAGSGAPTLFTGWRVFDSQAAKC